MTREELIEALAAKEHESWARWQTYLHSLCENPGDGSLVIPASRANFWLWEAASAYEQLPEDLKQYDRDEVAHILPIIEQYANQAREAALDEVQDFTVRHCFDTSVGRRIDDFITRLLERDKQQP